MFKKVRIRLTLLCAGISIIIMTVMSFIFLYVSEHELYQSKLQSFQNDINTISANLDSQSVISMEYLSRMEAQDNYMFYVTDNGAPFLYNSITSEKFENNFSKNNYLTTVIYPNDKDSTLEITVLCSLMPLKKQINSQRLRFILIDMAAVLILSVFSWLLTGRLLAPVIENQKKQNEFIASASHELRTPLAVILSASECLSDAPADKQEGFLKTIRQETLRMSSLVNDMLALSSSGSNRFSIKPKPIEIDTLLINSYEAFKPMAHDKNVSLKLTLPKNALPLCNADPDRLSQVVSILIHNAISYTPTGGRVEITLVYNKERFYISVKDNGIGISDEDKKKIFDRFYRAEKARSDKGHFGLGLSIAQEIVAAHNGSINVMDAYGGGSIFTVII